MRVSICMITYNHEAYIEKAIKSVLSQNTDFQYELVVSNDASTDGTHKIIESIISNHPKAHNIKYINYKENVGMMKNYLSALKSCAGKYIAICDGDDYWMNDDKLQMQYDFMEDNSNFNIVYTLNKVLYDNNELVDNKIKPINNRVAGANDLIEGNFITASSAMFRNVIQDIQFSSWMYSSPYGDWPMYLLLTRKGEKIKCLLHQTLVYRKNVGVISKMKQNNISILQSNYDMLSKMSNDENYIALKEQIRSKLYQLELSFIKHFNRNREYRSALKKMKESKQYNVENKVKSMTMFKIYLKSFFEGFFHIERQIR